MRWTDGWTHGWTGWMEGWTGDVKQAVRSLLGRPAGSAAAVLTLVLGIGASTAVFSLVRSVLLRPLPYPEPAELVVLHELHEGRERKASPAGYLDWRREARGFEEMAAVRDRVFVLREGERPVRVEGAWVSGNFLRTLGVAPVHGPGFDPALRLDAAASEAVLGHDVWLERFGGDPGAVGRTIHLDGASHTVVGVAPPGFAFPDGASLWVRAPGEVPPVGDPADGVPTMRDSWYFDVVARLGDGTGIAAAREEMAALAASLARRFPEDAPDGGIVVRSLHEETVGGARGLLGLLTGAVALVLLAACANVAGLTLARVAERERELAVRTALGSGRWRLVRLVLAESAALAAVGGGLGVLLAAWAVPAARPFLPGSLPRLAGVQVDGTVVLVGLLATTATGLVAGLVPALRASRPRPTAALRGRDGRPEGRLLVDTLVGAEVAAAVVLVCGTVLLLRSVASLATVDPGFEVERLALARATVLDAAERGPDELDALRATLSRAGASVSGAAGAAVGFWTPATVGPRATLRIVTPEGPVEGPDVEWKPVTPGWHDVVGTPLVAGRLLGEGDVRGAPDVAVVSRGLVRAAFGEADPLGRRVTIGLDARHERPITIVGVVADTRNRGPDAEPVPVLYRPFAQTSAPWATWTVAARAPAGSAAEVAGALREALAGASADVVVYGGTTGREILGAHLAERRFVMALLGAFGGLALVLGGVGVYGVAATAVSRRRREIGVRMAVGAGHAGVVGLVLRRGMRPVAAGTAAGLLLALLAGRALAGMLHGVAPGDPVTLAWVVGVLAAVAAAAVAVPAARAVAVDPAAVLRGE